MTKPKLDYRNIFYYLSGMAALFYIVLLVLLFTGFLPAFFESNLTYIFFIVIAIENKHINI